MDYGDARDEVLALVNSAWLAGSPALLKGIAGRVEWDNVPLEERPRPDEAWLRVKLEMAGASQRSMGGAGARTFEASGVLACQVFVPSGQGVTLADALAKILVDALEGQHTAGGVWFRDVGQVDVGRDEAWYQVNVKAFLSFDRVK